MDGNDELINFIKRRQKNIYKIIWRWKATWYFVWSTKNCVSPTNFYTV
jgi:hypothetical protein